METNFFSFELCPASFVLVWTVWTLNSVNKKVFYSTYVSADLEGISQGQGLYQRCHPSE